MAIGNEARLRIGRVLDTKESTGLKYQKLKIGDGMKNRRKGVKHYEKFKESNIGNHLRTIHDFVRSRHDAKFFIVPTSSWRSIRDNASCIS